MIHYNYSPAQLEKKAEELLRKFDSERLIKIKPIDVYEVIEKCLDVPYDWKYLTPDQSILGMTAFKSGYIWVWPKPFFKEGMKPFKVYLETGTIVIDSALTEYEKRGPENFTVMHEVFHQFLHKRCFAHHNPDYTHVTTRAALNQRRKHPMSSLEICEYQANACAAAFLMPRDLTAIILSKFIGTTAKLQLPNPKSDSIIREMARSFSVSQKAMRYRLLNLGLANN